MVEEHLVLVIVTIAAAWVAVFVAVAATLPAKSGPILRTRKDESGWFASA
jgi:hypothetical protein